MGPATFSVQNFNNDNTMDIAVAASEVNEFILLLQKTNGINKNSFLNIYQKPVTDLFHIEANQKIKKITLYEITGRLLFDTNKKIIDVSKYKSGYYFCQVIFDSRVTVTKKILIE